MTTPQERTRAVLLTEKFLLDLTNPKVTTKIPVHIREQAKGLLRHYPTKVDIEITVDGWGVDWVDCPFGSYEILSRNLFHLDEYRLRFSSFSDEKT